MTQALAKASGPVLEGEFIDEALSTERVHQARELPPLPFGCAYIVTQHEVMVVRVSNLQLDVETELVYGYGRSPIGRTRGDVRITLEALVIKSEPR